jgi:WD40 repeat protein
MIGNIKSESLIIVDLGQADDQHCFKPVRAIELEGIFETTSIRWLTGDNGILVTDSPVHPFLYMYDLNGQLKAKISLLPDIPEGACSPLGVRVSTSSGSIACFGMYDQSVKVYSLVDGQLLADLNTSDEQVRIFNDSVLVLRESLGGNASIREQNVYQVGGTNTDRRHPVEYVPVTPEETKIKGMTLVGIPNSDTSVTESRRGGIHSIKISPDARYIACLSDEKSAVVFVYDVSRMALGHILIHRQPVRDFEWDPTGLAHRNQLVIATGDARVFLWNPSGNNRVFEMKDRKFQPKYVCWASSGDTIIISDDERMSTISLSAPVLLEGG